MKIREFKLERSHAKNEFTAPYLLCCSDCEAYSLKELLSIADGNSLQLRENLKLGYTESQGHPILREVVSGLYETLFEQNENIDLIKFPPYQNIYDKKYAKPVLKNIFSDDLIMSKSDLQKQTGMMSTAQWGFSIKY